MKRDLNCMALVKERMLAARRNEDKAELGLERRFKLGQVKLGDAMNRSGRLLGDGRYALQALAEACVLVANLLRQTVAEDREEFSHVGVFRDPILWVHAY